MQSLRPFALSSLLFARDSAIRNPNSEIGTNTFLFEGTFACYRFGVNTLAEIEAAVESLPPEKKEELLRFLAARLRDEPAVPSQRLELSRRAVLCTT